METSLAVAEQKESKTIQPRGQIVRVHTNLKRAMIDLGRNDGLKPGITFTVEKPTVFHIAGIDKQQVGEVAANIRKIRPPEPYKGKGVRYQGEVIRRKAGKAGKK